MTTAPVLPASPAFMARGSWRPAAWLERGAAAALFILVLPPLVVSAAAVWILSGRPPFIAHRRMGCGGSVLWVYKLRTMWNGRRRVPFRLVEYVKADPAESRKPRADPRVCSRFAAFCRRYSIDELPQLLQVARGEMALVGPRPMTAAEYDLHYADTAFEILSVTPGLTGLWQIKGRSRLNYSQRRRLDLFLVRKLSPLLYAYILIRTPIRVVTGCDAW
jgi:exopolysaccharide production protein ExoY